ncbi:MAG: hypothetical protein K6G76_03915 [Lachnospiraceae bacterium]|nr:hypothetical protein [Lachnospiraceae bacterium]
MNEAIMNSGRDEELAIANKKAVIALTIICSIISVAYLLEVVKQTRSVGYVLLVIALAMIPVILSWIDIKSNPASLNTKHIVGIGYALMYGFVLLTTSNILVFTYAIPILIIITLYNDVKFVLANGIGVIVLNLIEIGILMYKGMMPDTATAEIQGLVVVMIVIYLIMVTTATIDFQKMRMGRLGAEHEKTTMLLGEIMEVSSKVTETVTELTEEMDGLKKSVDQTVESMTEVTTGTGESADAAQNQLTQTSEITEHIKGVESAARTINENVAMAGDAVSTGQKNISQMTALTKQVDTAGKDVASALDTFKETAAQMNSITDIITSVASQTSLLALNASIEAARAGEAGRGFAVVASEISNLAGQTTEATDNITKLINDITSQVGTMVSTIENLLEAGEKESQCASETATSFEQISEGVEVIKHYADELDSVVDKLAVANDEIANSVQTISAITEEVTAHATETLDISEKNQDIVAHINTLVEDLNDNAEKLKSHENDM